ncbi:nucleotide-binding domain-containing protein [Schizophyllum commune H4-8]|nr:nucleotide-binding domain-containing protein [Schizophyllum commune H4-8]KAI5894247.1 nucleotide-binding domain-containing protein [Schizophyllum commune H4-8]
MPAASLAVAMQARLAGHACRARPTSLVRNVLDTTARARGYHNPPSRARTAAKAPPSILASTRHAWTRPTPSILQHPTFGVRFNSTAPGPVQTITRRCLNAAKWFGFLSAGFIASIAFGTFVLFVHDACTYSDAHIDGVPVNPLALHPHKGGPKNLPVVEVLLRDEEDPEMRELSSKPRLVIVGGGWGAMGVIEKLKPGDYHVTIISAETYTTFTPLLPSAAVGTVQARSLMEPIRKIMARLKGHFIQGKAVDIVFDERLLEVETADKGHIYVPYDKLVIAVGSVSSTHGVPGLEHSFQLKTISDALSIRRRILENFEIASLPTTTPEERKRLLSFVVCGGGPTGVEAAAEIYDLCQEDIIQYYPKLCREEVSIHLIQSREHILNTYSEAISRYAEEKFKRDEIDLITNARVSLIGPDKVMYAVKNKETGQFEQRTIPTNFVLWSTGIAMNPFTHRVTELLPNQFHKKAIETDAYLRVKGLKEDGVYAIGDCATIETSVVSHFMDLVDVADKDKNGKIDFNEWEIMVQEIRKRIPMADEHLTQIKDLFVQYDSDADNSLELNELVRLLEDLGKKITSLPATAQVASQQGKYIGKKLHKLALAREKHGGNISTHQSTPTPASTPAQLPRITDEEVSKPFKYFHLGSLAYIGNAAVFDLGKFQLMGGLAAMYAWRSVYWNEQVSSRTRALLMIDWIVRGVWGRDLSKL